jgi:hypothetical protein
VGIVSKLDVINHTMDSLVRSKYLVKNCQAWFPYKAIPNTEILPISDHEYLLWDNLLKQ